MPTGIARKELVSMANEKQKQALAAGGMELRVRRMGMIQKLPFRVVRRSTLSGPVPYLVLDKFLDLSELMRISEEYQLPIEAPNGKIYPRGKKESDFAGL